MPKNSLCRHSKMAAKVLKWEGSEFDVLKELGNG